MNSINSLVVSGKLTNLDLIKANGRSILNFKVECSSTLSGKEIIDCIDCVAYGKMAEIIAGGDAVKEGCVVRVVGRLKQEKWYDGEKHHSRIAVVCEHMDWE